MATEQEHAGEFILEVARVRRRSLGGFLSKHVRRQRWWGCKLWSRWRLGRGNLNLLEQVIWVTWGFPVKGENVRLYVTYCRNLVHVLPASAFLHVAQRWGVLSTQYLYCDGTGKFCSSGMSGWHHSGKKKSFCFKAKHLSSYMWLGEFPSQRDTSITVLSY